MYIPDKGEMLQEFFQEIYNLFSYIKNAFHYKKTTELK